MPKKYESVQARLDAHSAKMPGSGCLWWTGASNRYGNITIDGKPYRSHRVAYEVANGPIPNGMYVCHTCDNPLCINPDHLFLGTAKDNYHDCINKGRLPRPSIFTDDDIASIRASSDGPTALAKIYGTSRQVIWRIKTGRMHQGRAA